LITIAICAAAAVLGLTCGLFRPHRHRPIRTRTVPATSTQLALPCCGPGTSHLPYRINVPRNMQVIVLCPNNRHDSPPCQLIRGQFLSGDGKHVPLLIDLHFRAHFVVHRPMPLTATPIVESSWLRNRPDIDRRQPSWLSKLLIVK
jgi:hypothetical protein